VSVSFVDFFPAVAITLFSGFDFELLAEA